MEHRSLGTSGIKVSRIGLGCVTFGREIDEKTSFLIMDYAFSQGIHLFDTAAAYGNGESERIVGRWVRERGCRDQIILQSKIKPPLTSSNMHHSLSGSLKRLQSEYLDIFLLHEHDPSTPLTQTMEAMTHALESGAARTIGCSNFTLNELQAADRISRLHSFSRLAVIQPVYNLVARNIERGELSYCKKNGIGIVSYSPLAAGFLTGKYSSAQATIPTGTRFDLAPAHRDVYFKQENFITLEKLNRIASAYGTPMSHLALAWVLKNSAIDSVLIGATSLAHVSNAIEALQSPVDSELLGEMDSWTLPHNLRSTRET